MDQSTHTNGADPQADERPLPVVVEGSPSPLERVAESPLPVPAVAATGGFLAGVAALMLVRVLRRSTGRRRGGIGLRRGKRGRSMEIAGSRSFLVDVHMLKR